MVKRLVVGQLKTNCYLVYDEECLIIDPGDDSEFISGKIEELEVKPAEIWLTHGHFDHVLAAPELSLIYDIPIRVNAADMFLIDRTVRTAKHFTGNTHLPLAIGGDFVGIDKIIGKEVKVIAAPGHTPGGMAFHFPSENGLFVGDTMFADGIGRADLSYSNRDDLNNSVKKLSGIFGIAYPGHGDSFVIPR